MWLFVNELKVGQLGSIKKVKELTDDELHQIQDLIFAEISKRYKAKKYFKDMQEQFGNNVEIKNEINDIYNEAINHYNKTSIEMGKEIMKEMAAKKTETREDIIGAQLNLSLAELKYIKSMIRNRIIHYESMKAEDWRGKKYSDCSTAEKTRINDELETCYNIFDHIIRIGIKEVE